MILSYKFLYLVNLPFVNTLNKTEQMDGHRITINNNQLGQFI